MTRARLVVAALLVAVAPRTAQAQSEAFARATAALAAAAMQPEPDRHAAVRNAVQPMAGALAGWDRALASTEARIDRELTRAAPARQFQLHVELAVAYRGRGRLKEALRHFDDAAALRPSSDLQLLRGLTLESAGRMEDAARAFQAAWRLDASSAVKAYYALRRGALASGADRDRARATVMAAYTSLAAATTRPPTAPFVVLDVIPDTVSPTPVVGDGSTARAFGLLASGGYGDAIAMLSDLERAPAEDADAPLAHFLRAQADEAANRVAEARHEYAAALPGTLAGRSIIYVAIGRLALVEGLAAEAIEAFSHAVRLNPNDPVMHRELAGAYVAAGAADEALVELIAGLLIDPANAALHAAIGQLHLDDGRPADALPALGRALELNPSQYEVRYALANALARLGRTDEAARQLELFERVRRERLDRRRQDIQQDVEKEEAIRRGLADADGAR